MMVLVGTDVIDLAQRVNKASDL